MFLFIYSQLYDSPVLTARKYHGDAHKYNISLQEHALSKLQQQSFCTWCDHTACTKETQTVFT